MAWGERRSPTWCRIQSPKWRFQHKTEKAPTGVSTGRGGKLVAGAGFEPTTSGFSPSCSSHLQLLPFYLLFREVSVYWRLLVFTADYQLLSPVLSPTFFTEIQGAPHSVYISPIRVVARVHVDVMPEIGCTHLGGYPSRDGPVIEHRAPVMGSH